LNNFTHSFVAMVKFSIMITALSSLSLPAFAQGNASKSEAVRTAEQSRTPEDPNLVWTPSQVVLIAKEIGPGVFAVYPDDAPEKNDAGIPVATAGGFVVGDDCVLVIESMLNRRLAEQMLALIRENTKKPIGYVVNTSYHGDHSYGNQFFPKDVQIIQHFNTQSYIQKHFKEDISFMEKYFGTNQGLDELKPQSAQILLRDGASIQVNLGNRQVQIYHLGFAQTEGDLFVWLPTERVIFTGNPVISDAPSLPWLLEGKLEESLTTMKKLRSTLSADAIVVPGHGDPTGVNAVDFAIRYLGDLKERVSEAVTQGLTEQQTIDRLTESMKKYSGYKIYPWVHSQVNIPKAYQELRQMK
jgi:cyclase